MLLFILGRQPEISLAELRAVYGNAKLILPSVALVATDKKPNINNLGSVRKVGRVIWDQSGEINNFLINKLKNLPSGKITLGVSYYGKTASVANARKTGISLKKNLNRSVRVLPNNEPEVSDAATLGNKLGSTPNKVELLITQIGQRSIIAELLGVQDLNAYTFRDRSRPKRDARVGMLPPKLAQTMINLAIGASKNQVKTVLDPFCGTGVVLQEAALMNLYPYGTDLEPRMIDYSQANLDWLKKTHHRDFQEKLTVGDATDFKWQQPIDIIATETYLGQPYAAAPPIDKLQQNIATCNTVVSKFLTNLASQTTPKTGLCVAVPRWFAHGKSHQLPLVRELAKLGFEQIFYSDTKKSLVYHRANQIVGRELLILRKSA